MRDSLLSRLVLVFLVIGMVFNLPAQSIENDTFSLRLLLDKEEYEECILNADSKFKHYIEQRDSTSAYWILISKLECLMRNNEDKAFHELSNRIIDELDPKKFYEIVKKVRQQRFYIFYHNMDKSFVNELKASCEFEKKYGSSSAYVKAILALVTSDIYNTNKQGKLDLLYEAEPHISDSFHFFRVYSKIADITKFTDKQKAERMYDKAYTYIAAEPRLNSRAAFHREHSRFLLSQGSYSKCISEALAAVEIYESDPKFDFPKMDMYRVISRAFYLMNQYDRSREYINKAIIIADDNKYKFRADLAKDNGQLFFIEGEYDLAFAEMESSIEYYESKKLVGAAVKVLAKLGIMYLKLGDIDKAKVVNARIDQVLHDFKEEGENNQPLSDFRSQLAFQQKDLELAQKELIKLSDPNKANVSLFYKEKAYAGLAAIFTEKNDYKNALKYTQLHQEINDSLTAVTTTQLAMQMESEYNRVGQNSTIAMLDQENKIQELSLSNQRNFIVFGSLILLGLGLFSLVLVGLFRKVKSQNIIIVQALEEKDVLLKEIHHRVKNNLQLVSSLLTLQSRDVTDEKALQALAEGKSRVRSMAIIHQDLYIAKSLKGISIKKYLTNLTEELFDAYKIDHDLVGLHLDVEDIQLDVDTIIPLGLIINELMTNTLKYAFVEGCKGKIEIRIYEKDHKLYLDMKDDGKGIVGAEFGKSSTFGIKLIRTLTKQLNGTLNIDGNDGMHVQIEIQDYKIAS